MWHLAASRRTALKGREHDMGSSSIKKLPDDQRKFIEKLLREDRLTLNEMLDAIRTEYPTATIPSRSALGREMKNFADTAKQMRKIQAAAEVLVGEFGEDTDDKAGALLTQAITTLTTSAVLDQLNNLDSNDEEKEKLSIKDIGGMARAARAVIATRGMSVKQREEIKRLAREELIAEQKAKLDALGKTGEVDQAILNKVIKAAYGL
jgi:hypothetical protein